MFDRFRNLWQLSQYEVETGPTPDTGKLVKKWEPNKKPAKVINLEPFDYFPEVKNDYDPTN